MTAAAPLTWWSNNLLYSCPERSIPLSRAVAYAACLSVAFVASLYVLIPVRIRLLNRDDDRHIQWRLGASIVVGVCSIALYPFIMCSDYGDATSPSALELLGFTLKLEPILAVLLHTATLYLGANVAALLQLHHLVKQQRRQGRQVSYLGVFKTFCIDPIWYPFWPQLRNLFMGPALEEVVFRACLVGPLVHTSLSSTSVAWLAPVFFGIAHIHHALIKLKEHKWQLVLLSTLVQFTYTSLFGAYVTHVFLRTQSLPAIILSHQYCNYMGLPDLSFFKPQFSRLSSLYPYRWMLLAFYVVGVGLFIAGFTYILL